MAEDSIQDWQESCDNHISQIAAHLVDGRIGFLFGAGMSIPSGGIPGSELGFQLVKKAFFRRHHDNQNPLPANLESDIRAIAAKFPLEAIAEGAMSVFSFQEDELEQTLKEVVFDGREPKKHKGHTHFGSLVNKLHIKTIYTTNWDDLLKQAIGSSAEIVTDSELRTLEKVYNEGKTAILHLHGTFDDDPLIREKDLMDPDRPLFQLFMADLMTKAFVFVGYSLSDFNIRALYSKSNDVLARRSSRLKKVTYVVAPFSSEAERRVASEVWRSRTAFYLPITADEFFEKLYREVVTHALDHLKARIRARLGITATDLQTNIENIMSVFPEFQEEALVLHYIDAATRGGQR